MKELYKNSQNVLSPMELEYMLIPGGSFDGQILRPSDGEVPKNIAFIYLAQQEFVTDKDAKFNDLELEYMLKLIGLIKNDHPEVNISLFTNTAEVTNLPKEFQYLKENLVGLDDLKYTAEIFTGDTFEVNGFENNTFEISNNSEKYFFDLLVIAGGLSVD